MCESKRVKNEAKISGLSKWKLPASEMRKAMWVKQLGEGKFGRKEHEFYFGHVEFETVNSHSSEDIK